MRLEHKDDRVAVFGLFRFDFSSKELRKNGIRLRLEEKPALVLHHLIESAGTIITRDELQALLWPNGVHVDFDHGLNKAISRLRGILGDDGREPRYIETLSRRGYRFIAHAKFERFAELQNSAGAPPGIETSAEKITLGLRGSAPSGRRGLWRMPVALLGIVLVAGLALALRRHPLQRRPLTELDTIVLTDLDNKTGDPVFDDALKQALTVELEQSPFLNVLPDRKINETLRMMGRTSSERITMDIGRDLCLRTGGKAVLGGSISSLGNHYVIYLNVTACSTDDVLANEQIEAAGKESVLKALSQASSSLRGKLGESLPSVQKYDVPVQVTTASLDALEAYSRGIKVFYAKGNAPSIPFFERAISLDPNFPMAYVSLAIAHGNQGEQVLPAKYAKKAYELRDRASELEKFRIDSLYFSSTGELEKENQSYELCIANYPRDPVAHANLSSSIAFTTGQNEKALVEDQEALRLAPDAVGIYENLALTYLSLNRLDDANATFERALARKLDSATVRQRMYYLAFLRGDVPQMRRLVAWGAGQPGAEDLLLSAQSDTEAYYGRINVARDFSRRAVESALAAGSEETAASWRINAALREAELGNSALARQGVTDALKLLPGRFVKMQAALALARIGDTSHAKALAEEVLKRNPSFVMLRFYWVPVVDAAIEISRGDPTKALSDLEAASPYESHQLGDLYPAYERGQAYLLAHNGVAAAVEFQKLLDHRGLVMNFVTGSLVHLQIARAYKMTGDLDKARAAYNDFFTLWKDADPNIPVLAQAKSEYAKL
jgi:eukaryotic-like serine/threonine-protein kinase